MVMEVYGLAGVGCNNASVEKVIPQSVDWQLDRLMRTAPYAGVDREVARLASTISSMRTDEMTRLD
jgi:demethoxyubiquinone hydroxylase (CLK1/Coq7/Cat5 family)